MKNLQLSDEKALELYKTADSGLKALLEENWGKDFFKPKPKLISDRVHDIDTLCDALEIGEKELYIFDKNTKDKHERYINACNILAKVANVYNEGTILNWLNTNQYKYIPYLYFSGDSVAVRFSYWCVSLRYSAGLYFKSEALARAAYKNFPGLYQDFWGMMPDRVN